MKALRMLVASAFAAAPIQASSIVYQVDAGPGSGKHIVFLASDHEYRCEETCPALARILAKHHGFKCTVVFGVDKDGFGQQVLGNTWVGHYGTNHKQGTRIQPLPDQRGNFILTAFGETSFCHASAYVGHAKKVKPSDLAGWHTPIMPARAKDASAE